MRVVHIGEREWEVFVEWEGRKPLHRAFRLLRYHREQRAHRRDRRTPLDDSGVPDSMGASVVFASVATIVLIGVVILNLVLWF